MKTINKNYQLSSTWLEALNPPSTFVFQLQVGGFLCQASLMVVGTWKKVRRKQQIPGEMWCVRHYACIICMYNIYIYMNITPFVICYIPQELRFNNEYVVANWTLSVFLGVPILYWTHTWQIMTDHDSMWKSGESTDMLLVSRQCVSTKSRIWSQLMPASDMCSMAITRIIERDNKFWYL